MNIAEELEALQGKLAQLEEGPAVMGDWHRLEARIGRALIHASNQLAARNRAMVEELRSDDSDWYKEQARLTALRGQTNELRLLRLVAQGRLLELQAEADQYAAARWARA